MGTWDSPPTEDEKASVWDSPPTAAELGGPISQEPGDTAQAEPSHGTSVGSKLLSGARALQKGGTLGFADELVAGMSSLPGVGKYLGTPLDEMARTGPRESTYKEALADTRGAFDKSHAENPGLSTGVEIATAIAMPGPGKAKAASALGRLAKTALVNAGLGAASGLGNSRASLLDGEVGQALKDTGLSAGLAGAASPLPWAVGEVGRKLAARAGRGVAEAVGDATASATKQVDKGINSAKGAYRGKVQEASRDLEVLAREAEKLPEGHPLRALLSKALTSDEGMALREQVAGNKLVSAPERLGEMAAKKAEFEALAGSRGADITKGAEEALANPVGKQVWPRVRKQVIDRALVPAVGAGVAGAGGALMSDDPGVGGALGSVGGALGGLVVNGLTGGRPSSAFERMMAHPGVRKLGWEAVQRALEGGSAVLGRYRVPLALAAASGGQALQREFDELAKADPRFRALTMGLVLETLPTKEAGP